MIFASTAGDIAVLITAACAGFGVLAASIVSLVTALASATEKRAAAEFRVALAEQLSDVHTDVRQTVQELKTLNGQTVGQLADADETRRIEVIKLADRTTADDEHIVAVPPLEPARKSRAKKTTK